MYNDMRKASEVHRAVRKYIKKIAVPGVKLIDLCETLEDSVRKLIEEKGLQARGSRKTLRRGRAARRVLRLRCVRRVGRYGRPHIESLACPRYGNAQRSGPPTVALVAWQTAFVSRAGHLPAACACASRTFPSLSLQHGFSGLIVVSPLYSHALLRSLRRVWPSPRAAR